MVSISNPKEEGPARGYFRQRDDFPEREINYLKGRPESSKLLVRIMSSERMMVTHLNAKKGPLSLSITTKRRRSSLF